MWIFSTTTDRTRIPRWKRRWTLWRELLRAEGVTCGISNYNAEQTEDAVRMLDTMGIHCLIHQMQMSMIHRENEAVLDVLNRHGVGAIAFSPLAQGY